MPEVGPIEDEIPLKTDDTTPSPFVPFINLQADDNRQGVLLLENPKGKKLINSSEIFGNHLRIIFENTLIQGVYINSERTIRANLDNPMAYNGKTLYVETKRSKRVSKTLGYKGF